MSDLQCPATFLIAFPGEANRDADGDVGRELSQETNRGPTRGASPLLDDATGVSDEVRGRVHRLVEQVRPRRVAAVYCSPMAETVEPAELAASQLGLALVVVEALGQALVGDLQARDESTGDLAEMRFRDAVEDIADVHRGETVLLLVHGAALAWVPRISVNGPPSLARQVLPRCVPAEVEVDADGWRLKSWPSGSDALTEL